VSRPRISVIREACAVPCLAWRWSSSCAGCNRNGKSAGRRLAPETRLGIPKPTAELYADHIDWHQARLVQRGCSPRLALRIVS
jgi:hypothetical protein